MLIDAVLIACALIGMLFFVLAFKRLRHGQLFSGTLDGLAGLVFLLAGAGVGLLGSNLLTYHRLTDEQPVLELLFSQRGERRFDVTLTYPLGTMRRLELRGDEWQIDARVLKWHGYANIIGFDAAYRLERIGGRYRDLETERKAPRTVHALSDTPRLDVWDLVLLYKEYLPWADAFYGSATYLPMTDRARYEVKISQTGLIARPLNTEAKQAVSGWR